MSTISSRFQRDLRRSAEGTASIIEVRLFQLFGRIHDERARSRDRLIQRTTSDEQETNPGRPGLDGQGVAVVAQYSEVLRRDTAGTLVERSFAFVDIDESTMRRGQRELGRHPRGEGDIENVRLGAHTAHGPAMLAEGSGDHAHGATCELDPRNPLGRNVLVARRSHLVARREVDPKLESPHQPVALLGHFGVDDPPPGGHPLHGSRREPALVAAAVAMFHLSGEHDRDRLEAAMWMVRKARDVVAWIVGAELVEHQERIDLWKLPGTEATVEAYPGAVRRGHGGNDVGDRTGRG